MVSAENQFYAYRRTSRLKMSSLTALIHYTPHFNSNNHKLCLMLLELDSVYYSEDFPARNLCKCFYAMFDIYS